MRKVFGTIGNARPGFSPHLCDAYQKQGHMNFHKAGDPISCSNSKNKLGTASRGVLIPLISIIHEALTRNWLRPYLQGQEGKKLLHWECGSGEDSLLIASLLDEQCTLRGIDANPMLIERAERAREKGQLPRIEFIQGELADLEEEAAYDFIYTRFWLSRLADQKPLFRAICRLLKPGGAFLAEGMQLADYGAYPYNYAFARAAELIGTLEKKQGNISENWRYLLQQAGFKQAKAAYAPPTFIPGAHKRVVSLILETFQEKILNRPDASGEELNALLIELRQLEQQEDILISRPGVWQVAARKKGSVHPYDKQYAS